MAYIQVYFDGVLQDQIELRTDPADPVSVGRDADNDIFIDNAGVSGLHATIWKDGETYVIDDAASTNGLVVNGERFQRKRLSVGDEIELFKYTLKFVESAANVELPQAARRADAGPDLRKATVEVQLSNVARAVRKRSETATGRLSVHQRNGTALGYPLNRARVRVGKSQDCEIQTSNWFGPRIAAMILRQQDGYFLKPERRGKVSLNGERITETKKLENGDRLLVRGQKLTFHA